MLVCTEWYCKSVRSIWNEHWVEFWIWGEEVFVMDNFTRWFHKVETLVKDNALIYHGRLLSLEISKVVCLLGNHTHTVCYQLQLQVWYINPHWLINTKRMLPSPSQQGSHTQTMISCCSLSGLSIPGGQRLLRQEIGNLISTINPTVSHPPPRFGTLPAQSPIGSAFTPVTGIELCKCEINWNPCSSDRHWTNGNVLSE